MIEIYRKIVELCRANQKSALCTVVQTKGSTPQGPGCKMLVIPSGQTMGTIGGGCVEAEVRRKALRAMDAGRPEIMPFILDHDYGWDDGLICGGRMDVFVDIISQPELVGIFEQLLAFVEAKKSVTLGTVIKGEGGLSPGLKFLFLNEERQFIGTECLQLFGRLPTAIQEAARAGIASVVSLKSEAGQPELEVFLEPILPKPVLLIAGAGHVGRSLAHLAALVDFEVAVLDDRADMVTRQRFPDASQLLVGDIPKTLDEFPIGPNTYVVIVTRGHLHDQDALYRVISRPAAYIGLIGSRRKVKMIFSEFRRLGVPEESLKRVFAPIGLDIRSETVPEIALSIAAQLVLVRRTRQEGADASGEQVVASLRDRVRPLEPVRRNAEIQS